MQHLMNVRPSWRNVGWTTLLLVVLLASIAQAQVNLIPNPDFMQGVGGKGHPLNWTIAQDTDNMRFELSTVRAVVGNTSALFIDDDASGALALRSVSIPINEGEQYLLQVDVWAVKGIAKVYIEYRDAGGARIASSSATSQQIGKWETLKVNAEAPVGAALATVLLYSDKANVGELYFDNIRLSEVF